MVLLARNVLLERYAGEVVEQIKVLINQGLPLMLLITFFAQ